MKIIFYLTLCFLGVVTGVSYRSQDHQVTIEYADSLYGEGKFVEAKARKVKSFGGLNPYQIKGEQETTQIKFVITDSLPSVEMLVSGREGNFTEVPPKYRRMLYSKLYLARFYLYSLLCVTSFLCLEIGIVTDPVIKEKIGFKQLMQSIYG